MRVDARRDGRQALGPVEHGVHRRHVGQQRLRGADVGGRLLAADVLLARLQRHAVGRAALRVHRHADDAAGRLADVRLAASRRTPRAVRRTRAAHRSAASCRARRRRPSRRAAQQRQRQQIGCRRRRARPRRARALMSARDVVQPRPSRPGTAPAPRTHRGRTRRAVDRPKRTSMPSGSARDRSTSSVCGKHRDRRRGTRARCRGFFAAPGAAASSPRPPRWPRRAATRWRPPCR